MIRQFLFLSVSMVILISCKENKASDLNQDTEVPADYFPVLSYLKGEIKKVDEIPGGIKKYVTIGDTVDSSYISHEEFHQLTQQFLSKEIEPENFEKRFRERKFYDQTIDASSFLYESDSDVPGIKRIDVLTKTSGVYEEIVSLYIEKTEHGNDTITRLLWTPGKEFQLYKTVPDSPSHNLSIRVVWDQFGGKQ